MKHHRSTALTNSPLTECGLIRRRGSKGIIIDVLTTDVEECTSKVAVSHGQAIVQSPQSSDESIRDSGETSTRGCIRFEHHERLACFLSNSSSIEVRLSEGYTGGVSKVHREHLLGLADSSTCICHYQQVSL